MEQIIKEAKEVFERRNLKSNQIAETTKNEVEVQNQRIEKEAKELVKLIIQLFDASNKEEGDYIIDDIMVGKSDKNENNLFCAVAFEKDADTTQTFIGYYELINLPYISKAIDIINHQKFDPNVLFEVMNIISKLEYFNINTWSSDGYKKGEKCAKSICVGI